MRTPPATLPGHDARPHGRSPRRRATLAAAVVAMVLAAAPVAADPSSPETAVDTTIPEWNTHVTAAFANEPDADPPGAGFAPGVIILHVAMAHLAMYDAVVAIEGGYAPYLEVEAADPDASTTAAAATAAHDVVIGVETVPPLADGIVERVDALWADAIGDATSADGPAAVADGIDVGQAAAATILAARADDGRFVPSAFSTSTAIGAWRPVPPAFGNAPFAWLGNVDPYIVESPDQFRTKGPHDLGSGIYAREYDELVRVGGPLAASERTEAQEATAEFFQFDPAAAINTLYAAESGERHLSVVEQARLFALGNAAGADAIINCFNDKEHWSFWRPITAINDGDADGNPRTAGDPDWVPRNGTPPYPEHPSGYNCVTGAFAHAGEAVLGRGRSDVALVKAVPAGPDQVRRYPHLRDIVQDTIDARIYQGLHFRAADVQGADLGRDVARWIARHAFRPAR